MHKKNRSIIFTLFCLLFVGVISAQEAFQCDELVREFISTMDETCPGMGRNEVCHGSTYAIAEFFDSELDHQGVFTRIGDIVSTSDIDRLYTAEYNPHIPQWGIALLKAQANIPNTLPGEIVTFILMGDTELSNSVEPDSQFESIARVPLRVERGVPAYYFPRVDSRVTIGVLAGAELFADARSSDNAWVRIVEDGVAGWIEISALDALSQSAATSLAVPVFGQAPMQAIHFDTDFRGDLCREAPSTLVIQGPEDYTIDITVNDVQIRMGSTIALRMRSKANGMIGMEILTIEGEVSVFPDTVNEIIIPAGYILSDCILYAESDLQDNGQLDDYNTPDCQPPRRLRAEEVLPLTTIALIPSRFLEADIFLPPDIFDLRLVDPAIIPLITIEEGNSPGDISQFGRGGANTGLETTIDTEPEVACVPRSDWFARYTIVAGDTLSSIAQRISISYNALATANCITDANSIFFGQQLRVPVTISTSTPTPTPTPTGTAFTDAVFVTTPLPSLPVLNDPVELTATAFFTTIEACTPPETWTRRWIVQEGGSYAGIALEMRLTVDDLLRANCIEDESLIFAGQEVAIPDGAATSVPSATAVLTTIVTNTPTASPTPTATIIVNPSIVTNAPDSFVLTATETALPDTESTCPAPAGWTDRHTVVAGDTALRLARQYRVSVNDLLSANCLTNPNFIFVGQILAVPVVASSTATPALAIAASVTCLESPRQNIDLLVDLPAYRYNVQVFENTGSCSGTALSLPLSERLTIVQASNLSEAITICQSLTLSGVPNNQPLPVYGYPGGYYECQN